MPSICACEVAFRVRILLQSVADFIRGRTSCSGLRDSTHSFFPLLICKVGYVNLGEVPNPFHGSGKLMYLDIDGTVLEAAKISQRRAGDWPVFCFKDDPKCVTAVLIDRLLQIVRRIMRGVIVYSWFSRR
jgi:hypothetical protein